SHYHENLSWLEYIDQNVGCYSLPLFSRIRFRNRDSDEFSICYDIETLESGVDVYQMQIAGIANSTEILSRIHFGYYNQNKASNGFNTKFEVNCINGNIATRGSVYYDGSLIHLSSKNFKTNIQPITDDLVNEILKIDMIQSNILTSNVVIRYINNCERFEFEIEQI